MGFSLFTNRTRLPSTRLTSLAAYLAVFTFGAPLVRKFFISGSELSLSVAVLPLIALVTIASVWPELGTVRDSELDATDESDGSEFPKRNRGFGERRNVPLATMPNSSTSKPTHTTNSKVVHESEERR